MRARLTIATGPCSPTDTAGDVAGHFTTELAVMPGYQGNPPYEVDGSGVVVHRFTFAAENAEPVWLGQLYRAGEGRCWVGTLATEREATDADIREAARALINASRPASPIVSRIYSVEELAALAEGHGVPVFPGTGEYTLRSERESSAARRALVARGTVRAVSSTALWLEPAEAQLIGTALRPTLVAKVTYQHPAGVESYLIYATCTTAVVHSTAAEGMHRLETASVPSLADVIGRLGRVRAVPPSDDRELTMTSSDFRRLRQVAASQEGDGERAEHEAVAILSSTTSAARVEVAPAGGSNITPGRLEWLDAGPHGLWIQLNDVDQVTLRPIDDEGLRARVADMCSGLEESTQEPDQGG